MFMSLWAFTVLDLIWITQLLAMQCAEEKQLTTLCEIGSNG
jgi:hypothetical protein